MQKLKDSEVLARLIYRAYIQPDPHAPLEAEALLPFQAALDLYARTARAETPPMLVAMDIPDETAKKVLDRLKNEPAGTMRPVSETDTGGTEKFTDRKVRWIIGGGSGGGGNGGGAGETSSTYIRDSQAEDEAEPEPAPAPARKKSETGMRGLNGGKATEEKREIYARLMAFCGSHGLGARRRIAEASGGKLSIADVQDMTDAKQKDIKLWRAVAAAMDRIEKEEDHATEEI